MFQGCPKKDFRVLQGNLKGVSRKSQGWYKEDWRVSQWSFKWVSRGFKRSLIGVWGKFQRCFKEDWVVFLDNFKGAWKVSKWSSKGVSREFRGSFKDILRVSKESIKCVSRIFQKKCQRCFKNVSMKFCFSILLVLGSHRSYLNRRRACFFWFSYETWMNSPSVLSCAVLEKSCLSSFWQVLGAETLALLLRRKVGYKI